MASRDNCQSPQRSVRYKRLFTISLGRHEMRFIGVNTRNNGALFPRVVNDCPGRLLFVGSDVLSSTSISRKNYVRNHVRYARMGLATKFRLTGFKIEGINNGGVVWFYSIQGLFHVAFEMGDLSLQKDCLMKLQDVWLNRFSDPPLPREGELRYNKRLNTYLDTMPMTVQSKKKTISAEDLKEQDWIASNVTSLHSQEENRHTTMLPSNQKGILCMDEVTNYVAMEMKGDDKSTCHGASDYDAYVSQISQKEFLDTASEQSDENSSDLNPPEEVLKGQKYDNENMFHEVLEYFRSLYSEDLSVKCTKYISLTVEFLQHLVCAENNCSDDIGVFQVMEEYLTLVNTEETNAQNSDCFGVAKEKYTILCVVSDWLGKEFHSFEAEICKRVNDFKKENIMCIDSLPSSETVISRLFPACMKLFIINWLGSQDKNVNRETHADHCYCAPVTHSVSSTKINFPLVQLILEFCCNCLISGIAHVVFSRLQAQNELENKASL